MHRLIESLFFVSLALAGLLTFLPKAYYAVAQPIPVPTGTPTPTIAPTPIGTNGSTGGSQVCITQVGTPSSPPPGPLGCTGGGGLPGVCQQAPVVSFTTAQEYANAIKSKWNITFTGMDLDQMQEFWAEFHEIDCVGFLQDIVGATIARWGESYAQQFSCPQDSEVDVMFGNFHGDFAKALITHELTHVWQFCTPRGEANLLEIPAAYNGEGGLTKYSRQECPTLVPPNDRIYHEDHADTIALYLNPTIGELTCGNGAPNPFSGGSHPLHRVVAEKGVPKQ